MQPDYILTCRMETRPFKGVGFSFPGFLHLDHHMIVANVWEGRRGPLKQYWRMHQKFLLSLPM
jgi:hypothetical protein